MLSRKDMVRCVCTAVRRTSKLRYLPSAFSSNISTEHHFLLLFSFTFIEQVTSFLTRAPLSFQLLRQIYQGFSPLAPIPKQTAYTPSYLQNKPLHNPTTQKPTTTQTFLPVLSLPAEEDRPSVYLRSKRALSSQQTVRTPLASTSFTILSPALPAIHYRHSPSTTTTITTRPPPSPYPHNQGTRATTTTPKQETPTPKPQPPQRLYLAPVSTAERLKWCRIRRCR